MPLTHLLCDGDKLANERLVHNIRERAALVVLSHNQWRRLVRFDERDPKAIKLLQLHDDGRHHVIGDRDHDEPKVGREALNGIRRTALDSTVIADRRHHGVLLARGDCAVRAVL
jgi:hypothetical protein